MDDGEWVAPSTKSQGPRSTKSQGPRSTKHTMGGGDTSHHQLIGPNGESDWIRASEGKLVSALMRNNDKKRNAYKISIPLPSKGIK